MMKKAIDYAKQSCDTMMRRFDAKDLPPKGELHYHQGVFLSGMLNTYKLCNEEKYFEYVKGWVDSIVYEDGSIHFFDKNMLDDIQPGILLLYLYKRTGEKRYKTAVEELIGVIDKWKTNGAGGFWHKECHPNQMWLDSLYMAGPFMAEYSGISGDRKYIDTAVKQAVIMYDNMRDEKSGLLFHAWDYSGAEIWADEKTGLSEEIWGRALGWFVTAILDIMENLPSDCEERKVLENIERSVLTAIVRYQDEKSGLWYQVVNKGSEEGNWFEISASALYTYSVARAVRAGILEEGYLKYAVKGYNGVIDSLGYDGDDVLIQGVCVGTGVCNYKEYIERPTSINDLHGCGAFLLMCAEMAKHNI